MRKTIQDLLHGEGDNYILPFFWQHGETEDVLREYMQVINDCGIGAVCVEARPHPDFVGPGWWKDLDVIIDEARHRGMKVWILDDAHYPTGQAAGVMKDADDRLCKQFVMAERTDVCGPIPSVQLDIREMMKHVPDSAKRVFDDESCLAVVAGRLENETYIGKDTVLLTPYINDGELEWDVPEGMWRIFVIYKTRNGGGRPHYINVLDEESCRVQIDAVYEPHYARYKDDFGKTIAGFFSDEPEFGNTPGYNLDESIGKRIMPLPWNKDMPDMLEERLGEDYLSLLPALWCDMGDANLSAKIRYAYMDTVTCLVSRAFSEQLGNWCEDRGVAYIGHIIEDNNQHSRLGCSLGHYFRSMKGQHMSGIDDIGGQVLPGGENHSRVSMMGYGGDGEFYHFILGKLGSSFAHIDPRKKGRAMCEIFGAYGWNTGVRQMKYLADHFLVNGINHYVPHAFSPKEFPDPDCPPHFYAHGHNPQYRFFQSLMKYLNRICHIFHNGLSAAPAAMLYHGEAEWTGSCMFMQKPARQLLENQIDFDIVPSDLFVDRDYYNMKFDKEWVVNGVTYQVFIIPYTQFITKAVADFIHEAVDKGLKVIFIEDYPEGICDAGGQDERKLIEEVKKAVVMPLEQLADYLSREQIPVVKLNDKFKRFRYYQYVKEEETAYMFLNEDPGKTFEGEVHVRETGMAYSYDAMDNKIYPVESISTETGTIIKLTLAPCQSMVIIFAAIDSKWSISPWQEGDKIPIDGTWEMSLAECGEYPVFKEKQTIKAFTNVGKKYPDFSGYIRYEKTFQHQLEKGVEVIISADDVYEGLELFVNERSVGKRISKPYRFVVTQYLRDGENKIVMEVANTLHRKVKAMGIGVDPFSLKGQIVEPSGIIGEVNMYLIHDEEHSEKTQKPHK